MKIGSPGFLLFVLLKGLKMCWKPRRNFERQSNKGQAKGSGGVTKFFISNLPSGCTPWEVSEFLGYFGEVVGSYIAKKRDKAGNRFGFITFRNVSNVVELERRMNGIKMGCCRLIVNIAKFAVENVKLRDLEKKDDRITDKHVKQNVRKQDNFVKDQQMKGHEHSFHPGAGRSFKAALSGKPSSCSSVPMEHACRIIRVPDNVVAFFELRGKALIGRVKDLKTLTRMKQLLVENQIGGLDIVYVGGLSILLNFFEKDWAVDMLRKKEVWSSWFSVLDFWEGHHLSYERVAWLKIHGVPINLATNEVFDDIASQFGKIIHPSQLSLEDGDISVGFVGILVGDGLKINETVSLKWSNKVFKTWISEEGGKWEPDCIGTVGKLVVEESIVSDKHLEDRILDMELDSKSDEIRKENESAEVFLEEGELKESMHGEEGGINTSVGVTQGIFNDYVASMLGVGEESERVNISPLFKVSNSNSGPVLKKRPIKILKKRNQRANGFMSNPVEVVRPKKRSRSEDDDPFDLDRFIGINHNVVVEDGVLPSRSVESLALREAGVSLDPIINHHVVTGDGGASQVPIIVNSGTDCVAEGGNEVQVCDVVKNNSLDKEVEATVNIGSVLGIDLEGHEGMVRNSIANEGINVVEL
ncbi:nucleotide-binding alpha-beta plait domain-containing protein [Artemisia annua]|uniref:Nucleotide-binding alpha-beta plait domain-containing protein n=1 Tax=Artemisia annua TaxID=35608 RepID=A0A2U1MN73_ARTAN|nr:nucleotide-binding alpha-beta plait domain-containing protein [Artemisia annua]